MKEIVARGIAWHKGQLPAREFLRAYVAHISGPDAVVQLKPVRFHTYACLHPKHRIYTAINTGEWPGLGMSANELRRLIETVTISQGDIDYQQEIAAPEYGQRYSLDEQWDMGKYMAGSLLLPVGLYAIGHTEETNEQVVYLMAALMAPLEKVVSTFKVATSRIRFK